jgi:hypothetical protein
MSGGSFNYLHEAFVDHDASLRDMADELRHLGFHDIARETESYVFDPPDALRKVWKAVEWWRSNDSSKEDAAETVRAYDNLHAVRPQADRDGFSCRCGRFFSNTELAQPGRRR